MANQCPIPLHTPWRRARAWVLGCATLLLLPTVASSQECPVPRAELNDVWRRAYEAYDNHDCVRFVEAAARYYGLVSHSTFSWNTVEMGRAYEHCVGVLDSALRERDVLREENAELRRRLRANGAPISISQGATQRPSLSGSPPHSLP